MNWRTITADRRTDFCPIALDLRDEFTGGPIRTAAQLTLETQAGSQWIKTRRQPTRNPGGVYLYTGLGRSFDPAGLPQFRARVTIMAPGYRPLYQLNDDALEFDVGTYNYQTPPVLAPIMPQQVLMIPAAGYRFSGHIRILKGRVLNSIGRPLADAEVAGDGVERVMTDESGGFSLPLRWQVPTATVAVTVQHPRSGTSANANFNLPSALSGNHDLTVN